MLVNDMVDRYLAGEKISDLVKEEMGITEGYTVGSYVKFNPDADCYFMEDQNTDSFIVFGQPMDGMKGKVHHSLTFKVVGYTGEQAKLVMMVNDNNNGTKAGEIYLVNRNDLQQQSKTVQPRFNKAMSGKYTY